jgi:hypothetical protein
MIYIVVNNKHKIHEPERPSAAGGALFLSAGFHTRREPYWTGALFVEARGQRSGRLIEIRVWLLQQYFHIQKIKLYILWIIHKCLPSSL